MAEVVQNSRVDELEERIEERTNRSLRQTMIFKGIAGTENESWSATTNKLAEAIADATTATFEIARDMINRAHRGGKHKKDIYANFHSWQDTQDIIWAFRNNNIQFPQVKIYANYKYGPMTSVRRSAALKRRKELKEAGEIIKGYIK